MHNKKNTHTHAHTHTHRFLHIHTRLQTKEKVRKTFCKQGEVAAKRIQTSLRKKRHGHTKAHTHTHTHTRTQKGKKKMLFPNMCWEDKAPATPRATRCRDPGKK